MSKKIVRFASQGDLSLCCGLMDTLEINANDRLVILTVSEAKHLVEEINKKIEIINKRKRA